MRVSRAAAIAAFCSMSLGSTAAWADPACWRPKERDAAQVHAFQTMLMVGTLHCRSRHEPAAEAYNRFVEKQRKRLKRHAKALERHFKRENGNGARAALDRYNTALANEYSHNFDRGVLCWTIASLADQAERADGEGLIVLAAAYARPAAAPECGRWLGF